MAAIIDITGQRFGRLVVLRKSEELKPSGAKWVCLCDCGRETQCNSLKLRAGKTVSCGCYRAEHRGNNLRTHGLSNKNPTYRTWKEMRQRCMNPKSGKWKWYGGRGIKICDRWNDYELFLADMGERPAGKTIDRIDNDGPYSPENCRWATQLDQTRKQAKNKLSLSLAVQLREDWAAGMTCVELSKKYGVSDVTAHRCAVGMTWASGSPPPPGPFPRSCRPQVRASQTAAASSSPCPSGET